MEATCPNHQHKCLCLTANPALYRKYGLISFSKLQPAAIGVVLLAGHFTAAACHRLPIAELMPKSSSMLLSSAAKMLSLYGYHHRFLNSAIFWVKFSVDASQHSWIWLTIQAV